MNLLECYERAPTHRYDVYRAEDELMVLDISIGGTGYWRFTMKRVRSSTNYREFGIVMSGLDAAHVIANRQIVKDLVAMGFCSSLNTANTKCTLTSLTSNSDMEWNSKIIVDFDDVNDKNAIEAVFANLRDADVRNAIENRLSGTGAIESGRQLTASYEHYTEESTSSSSSTNVGAVVGIAVGTVVGVAVLAVLVAIFVVPRIKTGLSSSAASILPDTTDDDVDELELSPTQQQERKIETSTVVVI